jgi:hypothetical protein
VLRGPEQVHFEYRQLARAATKTAGHIQFFHFFIILLLPERKFLNIIPARCRNIDSDVHLFGLMFWALQSKLAAPTTGSGALRRFLTDDAETQEPFLLNRVLDARKVTTGSSTLL